MNFDCRTLFVGDLPNYCSEYDLRPLFSSFGPVLDLQVHNGVETGRSSSYAFVTLTNFAAIEAARKLLDGHAFMGRKLRVRRATISHSKQGEANGRPAAINSIYVRFVTSIIDRSITEFDLHRIFSAFGLVEDVIVKDASVDQRSKQQYGYAFVHFTSGAEGMQCAFQAVSALDRATVDGLTLHAEVSRNLLKQFNQQQQQQQQHQAMGMDAIGRGPSHRNQQHYPVQLRGARGHPQQPQAQQHYSHQYAEPDCYWQDPRLLRLRADAPGYQHGHMRGSAFDHSLPFHLPGSVGSGLSGTASPLTDDAFSYCSQQSGGCWGPMLTSASLDEVHSKDSDCFAFGQHDADQWSQSTDKTFFTIGEEVDRTHLPALSASYLDLLASH